MDNLTPNDYLTIGLSLICGAAVLTWLLAWWLKQRDRIDHENQVEAAERGKG